MIPRRKEKGFQGHTISLIIFCCVFFERRERIFFAFLRFFGCFQCRGRGGQDVTSLYTIRPYIFVSLSINEFPVEKNNSSSFWHTPKHCTTSHLHNNTVDCCLISTRRKHVPIKRTWPIETNRNVFRFYRFVKRNSNNKMIQFQLDNIRCAMYCVLVHFWKEA